MSDYKVIGSHGMYLIGKKIVKNGYTFHKELRDKDGNQLNFTSRVLATEYIRSIEATMPREATADPA